MLSYAVQWFISLQQSMQYFAATAVQKAVQCSVVYWSDVLTAINANQDDRSGRPGLEVTEIIWQKCDAQNDDDSSNSTEHFSNPMRTPQPRASDCSLCQFLHFKHCNNTIKFGLKQQYCYETSTKLMSTVSTYQYLDIHMI